MPRLFLLISLIAAVFPRTCPGSDVPFSQPAIASRYEIARLVGHEGGVTSVAISADGKTAISGAADQLAIVWDVASAKPLHKLAGHRNNLLSVAITPDGKRAATGGADGQLLVWDVQTGAVLARFRIASHVHAVAISADGKTAMLGSCSGEAQAFDVDREQRLFANDGAGEVHAVAVNTDGSQLAVGRQDRVGEGQKVIQPGHVVLLDRDGAVKKQIDAAARTNRLQYRSDGKRLYYMSADAKPFGVIDAEKLEHLQTLPHIAPFGGAFSDDGSVAACAQMYYGVWTKFDDKGNMRHLSGSTESTRAVTMSADGKIVLAGGGGGNWETTTTFPPGRDNVIRVFDMTRPLPPGTITASEGLSDERGVVSSDGRHLLLRTNPPGIAVYDLSSGTVSGKLEGMHFRTAPAMFMPDGKTVAAFSQRSSLVLYDLALKQQQKEIAVPRKAGRPIAAISPDGRWCVTCRVSPGAGRNRQETGSVQLLDLNTGQATLSHNFTGKQVVAITFSPDSKYAILTSAVTSRDSDEKPPVAVRVLELAAGKVLHELALEAKVWSPAVCSSRGVVYFGTERTIHRWEVASGKPMPPLSGVVPDTFRGVGEVLSVLPSPDGQQLIVLTSQQIHWLNADTGQAQLRREVDPPLHLQMQMLQDGSLVLIGKKDGVFQVTPVK